LHGTRRTSNPGIFHPKDPARRRLFHYEAFCFFSRLAGRPLASPNFLSLGISVGSDSVDFFYVVASLDEWHQS
jgi:hypothetical protein